MRNERGASLLFLMLGVALAVLVAVWMALPWFTAARQEQLEKDVNRGVTPSTRTDPSQAAARERALMAEFVETHGGFKALAETEHYRALSAGCRELVDAYASLVDKPADAAADNAALRASVARIERSFEAECAESASAAAVGSPGSQAEMRRLGANLDAYRALTPECRSHVDTFVGLVDKPGLTPGDRERIDEADRLFTAQCATRPLEATANTNAAAAATASTGTGTGTSTSTSTEGRTVPVEDGRQAACAQKREEAEQLRTLVDKTLADAPPAPGAVDEDKRQRREALKENQSRLQALDVELATGCP